MIIFQTEGFTGIRTVGGQLRRWDDASVLEFHLLTTVSRRVLSDVIESVTKDVLAKPSTFSPVIQKLTLELGEQSTKLKPFSGTLWPSQSEGGLIVLES